LRKHSNQKHEESREIKRRISNVNMTNIMYSAKMAASKAFLSDRNIDKEDHYDSSMEDYLTNVIKKGIIINIQNK